MADIFISYERNDRDHAEAIAAALEEEGWSVWWDRSILPGKAFDKVIEKELDESKAVVVLWSSTSIDSDWVKEEIADAARKGSLVPALIEHVSLPLGFRRFQAADLCEWDGNTNIPEFQNFLTAVSEITKQPTQSKETEKKNKKRGLGNKGKYKSKENWRAEVVCSGFEDFSIRIYLTNEVHFLEYKSVLFTYKIYLNGKPTICENDKGSLIFDVNDGDEKYKTRLWRSGLSLSFKSEYSLEVDGRLLLDKVSA